jgi:hypothetical protein
MSYVVVGVIIANLLSLERLRDREPSVGSAGGEDRGEVRG